MTTASDVRVTGMVARRSGNACMLTRARAACQCLMYVYWCGVALPLAPWHYFIMTAAGEVNT
eukprot:4041877-Alexandrium_andersonii.AAC.1